MREPLDRREWLKRTGLAAAAAALLPAVPRRAAAQPEAAGSGAAAGAARRALRFAHLTDIHVQPERRAAEGMAACLRHVQAMPDPPGLIVTGGDLVMDVFEQPFDRTRALWDLFTSTLRAECSIPVKHCLGNHDIWGWHKSRSRTDGTEKGWGKAWACEALGMARPWHAFDRAGWHFIVLDSVAPRGDGYIGRIGEEQMAWLEADLAATPRSTPIVVVSHIPIISVCAIMNGNKGTDPPAVKDSLVVTDAIPVHGLLARHGGVRLCLSGHIHRQDRVEYDGITYICDGAVSGAWWKGPNGPCVEGFGVVDLMDDGTFRHRYATYGWKAEP
jgi:3',5'-cyclic AMP phosphodiesterase CpdA